MHDYDAVLRRCSPRRSCASRARGAWTAAIPFCHEGCPLGNLIPDWNDLVYRGKWREAHRPAARDQQLPRVHRPDLPRAVRVGVRAGDQRRPGDDRADRAGDRRARRSRRAGSFPSRPTRRTGKTVAVSAPGPAGLAVAAELNRCGHTRHRVRARRGPRRADALRRARRQAREGDHRPAGGASSSRRASSSSTTSTSGARRHAPRSCGPLRRARRRDRLARAPRPRRPGPRAERRSTSRWTTSTSATAGSRAAEGRPRRAPAPGTEITAAGKRVIVVGGGDTGMDCISNSHREGARERRHARRLPGAARRRRATRGTPGRCRPSARPRRTRSTRAASGAGAPR